MPKVMMKGEEIRKVEEGKEMKVVIREIEEAIEEIEEERQAEEGKEVDEAEVVA